MYSPKYVKRNTIYYGHYYYSPIPSISLAVPLSALSVVIQTAGASFVTEEGEQKNKKLEVKELLQVVLLQLKQSSTADKKKALQLLSLSFVLCSSPHLNLVPSAVLIETFQAVLWMCNDEEKYFLTGSFLSVDYWLCCQTRCSAPHIDKAVLLVMLLSLFWS